MFAYIICIINSAMPNLLNRLSWKLTHITIETMRVLLIFAMICFLMKWAIDHFSGIIMPFDAAAYPICLVCFALSYGLSYTHWLKEESLYGLVYTVITGYLISTSIYHHMIGNGHFSNAAQWLGLNYVTAYLFLDVRRAGPTTLLVLFVTLIGHYCVLIQQFPLSDTLGVVLNIGIAHLVYIVLLWTVVKMRIANAEVRTKVRILDQHAHIDPLTRLLNRRGLARELKHLEADYKQCAQQYAVFIIDIDHFKLINDQYGHLIGDHVLVEFSHLLDSLASQNEVVGRWGGEEFVVLTKKRDERSLFDYAERIRVAIEEYRFTSVTHVTASIGICHCSEAENTDQMFNIADKNLYRVKQRGRNQVMATPKLA